MTLRELNLQARIESGELTQNDVDAIEDEKGDRDRDREIEKEDYERQNSI